MFSLINTLEKRFLGLTNVQIGLFSLPTIVIIGSVVLFVLNRKSRYNPFILVSLILSLIHFYHHYKLAKLENKQFKPTLKKEFQWSTWAVVKDKAGKVDFNKTLTGPDLKSFIDDKLFPYLKSHQTYHHANESSSSLPSKSSS